MAKTLLNGVNDVLYKVRVLQNTAPLTSLTQSSIQTYITLAVQSWNEIIDDLYSYSSSPKPKAMVEATITLVDGDRDYALAADLTRLYFPLINETDGLYLGEYPGGWWELVKDQPNPSTRTGQPTFAAIRPDDQELYLDSIPSASEDGNVYKYRYDKDLELVAFDDVFPFDDVIYRALTPAVAEVWRRNRNQGFDNGIFQASMGRAARFLSKVPPRSSYRPRQHAGPTNQTDPFNGNGAFFDSN